MTGFEPRISVDGSDHSTNWATTTTLIILLYGLWYFVWFDPLSVYSTENFISVTGCEHKIPLNPCSQLLQSEITIKLERFSLQTRSSIVEGDEDLDLPNCQSNLVIALDALTLLFCIFINATAYHCADTSLHLPLAVTLPATDISNLNIVHTSCSDCCRGLGSIANNWKNF